MSTNGEQLHRAYHTLSKREGARLTYSQSGRLSKHRDPQHAFYSVVNSVKNRTSNRYDNIFAYDRTSVIVDDEGYLNANVVCDTKGAWWVASQVRIRLSSRQSRTEGIYRRRYQEHSMLSSEQSSRGQQLRILLFFGDLCLLPSARSRYLFN